MWAKLNFRCLSGQKLATPASSLRLEERGLTDVCSHVVGTYHHLLVKDVTVINTWKDIRNTLTVLNFPICYHTTSTNQCCTTAPTWWIYQPRNEIILKDAGDDQNKYKTEPCCCPVFPGCLNTLCCAWILTKTVRWSPKALVINIAIFILYSYTDENWSYYV